MPVWIMKDGGRIEVSKMINSHLLNVIAFISQGGGYSECVTEELAVALMEEVEKRGLKTRVNKEAFIKLVCEREYLYLMGMQALEQELGGN